MKKYILAFIAMTLTYACHAQVDRSTAPDPDEPKKLDVGVLIPIEMDNGLQVYLAPIHKYPKFTISVSVELPPYNEDEREEERGILSEAYSSKLSQKYPNGEVDSIPSFLGAMMVAHLNGGTIKGMKRDIDQLLELYSDALLNPIIKEEYITKKAEAYQKKLESKKSKKTTPKKANLLSAESMVDSLLFGESTLLKSKSKKTKVLNYDDIKVSDVERYLKDMIVANNTIIVVVGNFTPKECKKLMDKYFSNWQQGERLVQEQDLTIKKAVLDRRKIVVTDSPNAVQSKIAFNWHLEDAFTFFEKSIELEVLNEIFGESQLSYLYKNIREDKGLCYSIRSSVGAAGGGGRGAVYTSVKNDQTAFAIENIILEMLRIRNFEVTDEDLKVAKSSLIGEYTRSLSGVAPIPYISFAMMKDQYNLPDDYLQTKVSKYYRVTKKDIMELAQKYIDPFKCVITVKGKVSDLKGSLEKFGEVIYLDEYGAPYKFDE